MKIATWNINGIKARIDNLLVWLDECKPDIVCLQEIKSTDETFPREKLENAGYHVETHGQKSFNGVALLSRRSPDDVYRGLPGDEDDLQARYLEGVFSVQGGALRVASIYLPNGNPVDSEKYPYKLKWIERLRTHARQQLALEEPLILAGDYNVIPRERDCHDPAVWAEDALFRQETRQAFNSLTNLGLYDAVAASSDAAAQYTFWDYQAGAWPKDNGIRIDHMLLSGEAADRLGSTTIERHVRSWEKPSDHVPVVATLAFDWI